MTTTRLIGLVTVVQNLRVTFWGLEGVICICSADVRAIDLLGEKKPVCHYW